MQFLRRRFVPLPLMLLALLLGCAALPARAQIKTPDDADANAIWDKVRASLFDKRPIEEAKAAEVIELDAPVRAEDAAVVPIAIHMQVPQTARRYIDAVYLLIDNNPSPIAAIFHFTPRSGRADIETRVRINDYSFVRAIAEMNDGSLYMASQWVKASGGCSAPAGKDQAAALATLGRMKFLYSKGDIVDGEPKLVQLMISHPNNSGLAMDQFTREYAPSHFVRSIKVSYEDKMVMTADLDISISENPNFRFYVVPQGRGELKAEVEDSHEQRFQAVQVLQ